MGWRRAIFGEGFTGNFSVLVYTLSVKSFFFLSFFFEIS